MAAWCATCNPLATTPNNSVNTGLGSIWQGGGSMVLDPDGNIVLATGNGSDDGISSITATTNYGDAYVKLSPALAVLDYFVPNSASLTYQQIDAGDLDIGSVHPVIVPGQRLIVGASKHFQAYSISLDHMGGVQGSTASDPQNWSFNVGARTPTIISGAYSGMYMHGAYFVPMVDGPIQRYGLSGSTFATSPSAATTISTSSTGDGFAFPGTTLAGSYNSTGGTGDIIWATTAPGTGHGTTNNAFTTIEPGTLRAFRASDLVEIYNSDQAGSRDTLGTYAKWSAPTIAGGRVYVPTFDGSVAVYGPSKRMAFFKP